MADAHQVSSNVADPLAEVREKLARILDQKSFRFADEPIFKLASGKLSPYYIDCKTTLAHAEARKWIGRLIIDMLGDQIRSIQGIGGLELGAVPVAIAASDFAHHEFGLDIPVFIVRKNRKEHGSKKTIEGTVQSGDRVVIVDDVITTGGSTAQAIQACLDAGLQVDRAIAIIDRMEDRDEPVTKHGIELESLMTLQDLLALRG